MTSDKKVTQIEDNTPNYQHHAKKTSRSRKNFGKVLLSIFSWMILIFVVICIVAAIAATSVEKDANGSSKQHKTVAQAKIGQTLTDAGFSFVVNSIKCGEKRISFDYALVNYYTDAQGEYCRLNVTVTNAGNTVNSITAHDQYLFNSKGQRYDYDSTATGYAARYYIGQPFNDDINPGNNITGDLIFDTPVGVNPNLAELHGSSSSKGAHINLQ